MLCVGCQNYLFTKCPDYEGALYGSLLETNIGAGFTFLARTDPTNPATHRPAPLHAVLCTSKLQSVRTKLLYYTILYFYLLYYTILYFYLEVYALLLKFIIKEYLHCASSNVSSNGLSERMHSHPPSPPWGYHSNKRAAQRLPEA